MTRHRWLVLPERSRPKDRRPSADHIDYSSYDVERTLVRHPHDDGVWLADASVLGELPDHITAVVSLCLLGRTQVPPGVQHVGYRLIDHPDAEVNPDLDFVLTDAARTVAALRAEGHEVLIHCVAAQSRTPTVGIAYSLLRGIDVETATAQVCGALPQAYPNSGFRAALKRLEQKGDSRLNDQVTSSADEHEQRFTVVDVGILILEAVGALHDRGHQRLRILPGMSGSGMYWRTAVTHGDNFATGGHTHLHDFNAAFTYTTGDGFEIAGRRVDASTTSSEMADLILRLLPDPGVGDDPEYVAWYGDLMDLVRTHHALPIAYADYFDDEDGWEIGWGSGLRIDRPPSTAAAHVAASQDHTGAMFRGTLAQFNRYLGPHWRVLVQQLTKKHKAAVGACEFDPAHTGPFDAAHIHGRERTTLIRHILGNPAEDEILTVDILAFEARFKEEHKPVEKSILVLCKPCHQRYDSSPSTNLSPPESATSLPDRADDKVQAIAPGALVLPITLEPRNPEAFKAGILESRAAWIDVYFRDGHVERQLWRANKLTEDSNVVANLRSRPNFRQGTWQALEIVTVHVTVAHVDLEDKGSAQ